jgi:uncharacterized protein involved in outer membrane biogenesis
MKRFILSLLGIIVLLVIGGFIVLALSWSSLPDIIANKLSSKMKVSVEIEDIQWGWNAIDIQKIEIGNPTGSILPKAFSAEDIVFQAPISNYLKRNIVIDEVDLKNVYVGLEFDSKKSKKGNWTTIIGNLQGEAPKKSENTSTSKTEKPGRTVLIKKLILTNISVALVYRQGGGQVQNLPPIKRIELDNISSEEGLPTEQISNIIFQQMLKQIFSIEGLQNMLQDLLPPSSPVQKGLNMFKNFFNSDAEEPVLEFEHQ